MDEYHVIRHVCNLEACRQGSKLRSDGFVPVHSRLSTPMRAQLTSILWC